MSRRAARPTPKLFKDKDLRLVVTSPNRLTNSNRTLTLSNFKSPTKELKENIQFFVHSLLINSSSLQQTSSKISHTPTNSVSFITRQHNSLPFCPIYSIKDPLSSPDYWLTIPTQPDPLGLGRTNIGDSLNEQILPIQLFGHSQGMIGAICFHIAHNPITLHHHIGIGIHSSSSSCVPANMVSHS